MKKITDSFYHGHLYFIDEEGALYNKKTLKQKKFAVINSGYRTYTFSKNLKPRNITIHRLMWLSFNGEIPEGKEINHIDGNKLNNSLSNLECCTRGENEAKKKKRKNGGFWKTPSGFAVSVTKNKSKYWVGRFETEEQAREAYSKKFIELYGFGWQ